VRVCVLVHGAAAGERTAVRADCQFEACVDEILMSQSNKKRNSSTQTLPRATVTRGKAAKAVM